MRHSNYSHAFELLIAMTEKELVARYKNTFFGFLWILINPILQMIVIGFIFRFFIKEPIPYYFHHLFIGLLAWGFFSLSLTKATPSIVFERSLIKKAMFPREVIPLSIVLSNFIHLCIAFILYIIAVIVVGKFTLFGFGVSILSLVLLLIFTSGLSLLVSALNVRFRDMNFFVQALLTIWFYATPIIYSLRLIPANLLWLWRFNPLTTVMQLFQYGFLDGAAPGVGMMLSNLAVVGVVLILGIIVFQQESKYFDDWI